VGQEEALRGPYVGLFHNTREELWKVLGDLICMLKSCLGQVKECGLDCD
jgi:hypothetical protein